MHLSITQIKELHAATQSARHDKVDQLSAKLAQVLDDGRNDLDAAKLIGEISASANSLQGTQRTEYLENAFSMIDATGPFTVDPAQQQILEHIKSLLSDQYFSTAPQINFTKDVHQEVVRLVERNHDRPVFEKALNKIHINSNKSFHASAEQVASLRAQMANILLELPEEEQEPIKIELIQAISSKDIGSISADNPFWKRETRDQSIRKLEADLLNKVFPEVISQEAYSTIMEAYSNDPAHFPPESYAAAVKIFVKSDQSHPYQSWVHLLCDKLHLDKSQIILSKEHQHFYIQGKPHNFIPGDGNCAFHCIQYLIETT